MFASDPVFADAQHQSSPIGASSVALKTDLAKQYVQTLASSFGNSLGLNYSDQLTVKSYAPSPMPPVVFNITGELARPGKYKLNLNSNGTLISDGIHNIAIDPARLHYARYKAPGNLTLGDHWRFISTSVLSGASALNETLIPYLYAHINDYAFLHPTQMTMTGAKVTINGKSYIDIEYKGLGDDIHLKLDPKTSSLIGADATYVDSQGRTTEAIETLSMLTPMDIAPAPADFSTKPPPGSIEVPIPRETPPVQRAPARPSYKRYRKPGYYIY
jgi:hypothetical protein